MTGSHRVERSRVLLGLVLALLTLLMPLAHSQTHAGAEVHHGQHAAAIAEAPHLEHADHAEADHLDPAPARSAQQKAPAMAGTAALGQIVLTPGPTACLVSRPATTPSPTSDLSSLCVLRT